MSETNITALKEALCAQQQLLQKLYNELDVERESSATAASETLSMILRLQGEKAAVTMEAEHYKRLAEEKIWHAEESMAIFEDIMYQKEMEIAALDYQVQSYRYKLISMGCIDPGTVEVKYPENLLKQNENLNGETSFQSLARRNSAPVALKLLKSAVERERSESPDCDSIPKEALASTSEEMKDRNLDMEKQSDNFSGDINSYWEQIRKLDERVKGLTGGSYASPLASQESPGISSNQTKGTTISNESDEFKRGEDLFENENTTDSASSSKVHDVFEVPQAEESIKKEPKNEGKMGLKVGKRLEKMVSVPPDAIKDETDWLKKMLMPTHRENNLRRLSDSGVADSNLSIIRPTTGVLESRARLPKVSRKREIIEVESNRREEELKKLNEIQAQLNSIQFEIRSLKTKKSSPLDDFQMHSLMETCTQEIHVSYISSYTEVGQING
ncbi:hypothetical protein LguiB_024364 [Lonicera macranthoides]